MKFNKAYYEKYALLTIADCLHLNADNFRILDKPDLQNDMDSIGVEVTRAITQNEGFTIALTNKHFGKGKSGKSIKQEIENEFPVFNGNVMVISGDIAAISPSKGMVDTQNHLVVAENSILEKLRKFKGYKLFSKNYLYLFLETSIFEDDEIHNFVERLTLKTKFEGFLINCIDKIHYYENGDHRVFEISDNKLKEYKLCAEE